MTASSTPHTRAGVEAQHISRRPTTSVQHNAATLIFVNGPPRLRQSRASECFTRGEHAVAFCFRSKWQSVLPEGLVRGGYCADLPGPWEDTAAVPRPSAALGRRCDRRNANRRRTAPAEQPPPSYPPPPRMRRSSCHALNRRKPDALPESGSSPQCLGGETTLSKQPRHRTCSRSSRPSLRRAAVRTRYAAVER